MTLKPTLIFLLLLCTSIVTVQSQPTWFPENAEWYYHAQCASSPECGFVHYYTAGDTLLAGYQASIVEYYFQNVDFGGTQSETHFFREANDTVFYYSVSNQMWGMLYDFNAQPGDVWDLTETLADVTMAFGGEVMIARVEVDTVSYEMISGEMRKLIHTIPLYDPENIELSTEWEFMGPIAEGIGPVGMSHGLFGESTAQVIVQYPAKFSCYRENGELVYGFSAYPCGVVSNVEENAPISFSVFPNPTASIVNIELPQHVEFPELLRLYNIMGQQVKTYPVTQFPLTLNLGDLPAGMYVLEGETSSGARMTSRIVKALE